MSCSIDYRKAAIEFKEKRCTFKKLKKTLKITPQTYYNWLELEKKPVCSKQAKSKHAKKST
jgi:uncharacterized HAD superfamily protein